MKLLSSLRQHAATLRRAVEGGLADSGHAAVYVRQLLRGNRTAHPVEDLPVSGPVDSAPVLLLHGYFATRGSVHLLQRRLMARGRVVVTYRLGGTLHLGDIRKTAAHLGRKIDSLLAQTGAPRVDIVAHSMGGLVALDYLKHHGGAPRVRRLILLGTPVQGTWSAILGLPTLPLGRASAQLLPQSAFLRDLASGSLPAGPDIVAVAASRDWLAPPDTTHIPGVRQIVVPTGHSGLLVDEEVARTVSDILAAAPAAGAPPPSAP